jgi:phosphatidylinositol alpha-mannosyltransferase
VASPGLRTVADDREGDSVRIGIVVPYSWSFWGAVIEHSECQAAALSKLGVEVVQIMGYDPPGPLSRVLHSHLDRAGELPSDVIPVGGTVVVPANGSRPNIILAPYAGLRMRRVLAEEDLDLLHLHEPMTPIPCLAALALSRSPIVATFHAGGKLMWNLAAKPAWGFLADRIDHRIAVSEVARRSANRWYPSNYEIIPNGTVLPDSVQAKNRAHQVICATRHERRKGLEVLLRAWPEIRNRTGLQLRIAGAEPRAVSRLMSKLRVPDDGIEILGFLSQPELTAELCVAKASISPSIGGESFGMALTRSFGSATPVVASDIPGYREVMSREVGLSVEPGNPRMLAEAVIKIVADEAHRIALGEAARAVAEAKYSWDLIAGRLLEVYEGLVSPRS